MKCRGKEMEVRSDVKSDQESQVQGPVKDRIGQCYLMLHVSVH